MIVKLHTARLAKEKNFNVPTFSYYIKLHTGWQLQCENKGFGKYNWNERKGISAPDQWILQEWLENNHKYFIDVLYKSFDSEIQNGFYFKIYTIEGSIYWLNGIYGKNLFYGFDTYEDALEVALQLVLINL